MNNFNDDICSTASCIRIAATELQKQQQKNQQRYSSGSDDDSGCVMDEYAWVPSGIKPDTIHSYFALLPEEKVPYVNSAGEQWRLQQLTKQLPPQDSDPRFCSQLNASEIRELNIFEKARKKRCLGKGLIQQLSYDPTRKIYCHQCKLGINVEEELVISAPERFGDRAFWHAKCFVCVECQELLVDLIYFRHNENVFCGRHHAEQIKPRCANCDELIVSEECVEAEGLVWHMNHFICQYCKTQLGGQRYIQHDQKPYCVPCYKQHQATTQRSCHTCQGEIIIDQPHITQGELRWHADANCFCCALCQRNLLGKRYTFNLSRLICGPTDGCNSGSKQQQFFNRSSREQNMNEQQQPDLIPFSARVRFQLEMEKNDNRNAKRPCAPPLRSPPPIPKSSPNTKCYQKTVVKTPPENIYETVLTLSPSTSNSSPNHISNKSTLRHATSRFRQVKRRPESITDSTEEDEDERVLYQRNNKMRLQNDKNVESSIVLPFASRRNTTKTKPIANLPRSRSADGKHRKQSCEIITSENVLRELKISSNSQKTNLKNPKKLLHSYQNYYSRMPPDDTFVHYANSGIVRNHRTYSSYSTTSSSESDADDSFLEYYLATVSLPRQYNNAISKNANKNFPTFHEKTARKRFAKLAVPRRSGKTTKSTIRQGNKSQNSNSNCIVS